MLSTGVDLIDLQRIEKILKKSSKSFIAKVATASETSYLTKVKDAKRKVQKVAGLFALKEAFAKALGTGIGEKCGFHDIEVSYTDLGQPELKYLGSAFNIRDNQVACSISHEGPFLVAFVVIVKA